MLKKSSLQQSPRASHAFALLSSLMVLSGCGGGQGDAQSLESSAADSASALEVAAAAQRLYVLSSTPKTTTTTTTATVPKTTTATKATTTTASTAPSAATLAALTTSASIGSGRVAKSAATTTCGVADIGGWTVPTPAKADASVPLTHIKQPGSRLFYISAATGSDTTGQMYFWNGSAIVDSAGKTANASGQAYGTDPMNPSSAVKPYKRWAQVMPRANGGDVGTAGIHYNTIPTTRAGYPDWWMFARGETFNLKEDLYSFINVSNPGLTNASASLAVSGGRSASEPQVVGAYGSPCAARPRFINPIAAFVSRSERSGYSELKNVAYLSLHFFGHGRADNDNYEGVALLGQPSTSTNILFEDMWFDAATVRVAVDNDGDVTFRRSLITDAYSPIGESHVQGFFYGGGPNGRLKIEESILLRNGFRGDPAKMTWPPTGNQAWNIYNRNMYLSGKAQSMQAGVFDSVSMMGTSGDQFRPGMRIERNFFYNGYVVMGGEGGQTDSYGATGSMLDNVLQRFVGTGTTDNRGQPGWGLSLVSGAAGVKVERNIVTGAQSPATSSAFLFDTTNWLCYSHTFKGATRDNTVQNNILDSGIAPASVDVLDGVTGESTPGCAGWINAGVKRNKVNNNVLINSGAKTWRFVPSGGAVGTTNDTAFSANAMFPSRASAAAALGWPDANRTLRTYMLSNGVAVTSADGFPEYFDKATKMRRGQWPATWTSKALINYTRAGFAVPPLP